MYTKQVTPLHASTHLDEARDEINEGLNTLCIRVGSGVRPSFGNAGRLWFAPSLISRDSGSAWAEMSGGGGGKPQITKMVAASDALTTAGADYICTGADDQDQINSAIAAVASIGGLVLLSEGTFEIEDSILLESNVILMGSGRYTVLHVPDGTLASFGVIENADQNATGNSRITIRDLTIDGNSASALGTNDGIAFYNVDRFAITCVEIRDVTRDAISLNAGGGLDCSNGKISRCILDTPTQYGIAGTCDTLQIVGNQILTADRGVNLSGGGPYAVSGNEIDACVSYGIVVYRANGSIIGGNPINGAATCHAINVYGDVGDEVLYCTISGNPIDGCLYGIELANIKFSSIGGNIIVLATNGYGIAVTTGTGLSIGGNHILGTTGSVGISLDTVVDSTISANRATSHGTDGIKLTACERNALVANFADSNTSDGIELTANDDWNVVVGNYCRDNTGWGITIANANCDENVVQGNTALDNTAGEINDGGTNSFIGASTVNNNNLTA